MHKPIYAPPEPPRDMPALYWQGCGIDARTREVVESGVYDREQAGEWWTIYDRLEAMIGTGMLVCLVGIFGTGKTVMAAQLIREVCLRGGFKPRYITAPKLFRRLTSAFDGGPPEEETLREFSAFSMLAIDEAHERSNSEYADRRLREIVNLRYGHEMDTILISNLSPREFAASVGGSVIDRARQCGGIMTCNWPSFRTAAP